MVGELIAERYELEELVGAGGMSSVYRAQDTLLERHQQRVADRQPTAALDQLLEVLALDVLEDDELAPFVLAAVDDGDDVRVAELGDRARLAAKALDVLLVGGELLVEDLDRDRAVEQAVVGLPDAGHPAASDELEELVATGDHVPRSHAGERY